MTLLGASPDPEKRNIWLFLIVVILVAPPLLLVQWVYRRYRSWRYPEWGW